MAECWVAVIDTRTADSFRLEVHDGEGPVDVFNHPYAYAALHGVQTQVGAPDAEDVRVNSLPHHRRVRRGCIALGCVR